MNEKGYQLDEAKCYTKFYRPKYCFTCVYSYECKQRCFKKYNKLV